MGSAAPLPEKSRKVLVNDRTRCEVDAASFSGAARQGLSAPGSSSRPVTTTGRWRPVAVPSADSMMTSRLSVDTAMR